MKTSTPTKKVVRSAAPLTGQHAREIQAFGSVVSMPIALAEDTRRASVNNLNQLLADTITLRDLYKKHHWQVSGPTFYQLHLLFDKHFGEQNELVDLIAERIMMLGGISVAMAMLTPPNIMVRSAIRSTNSFCSPKCLSNNKCS